MKLLGRTKVGSTLFEIDANSKRVVRKHTPVVAIKVAKLTVYCDGLGSGVGDQVMRSVIYTAAGVLVAQGSDVHVADGQPPGWVDLPFTQPVSLPPSTDYFLGLHAGANANTIRVYGDSF